MSHHRIHAYSDPDENKSNYSRGQQGEQKKYFQSHQGKFTCRYEIQIKKDKEFDVPKRIIGSKGHKMKEIIRKCEKEFSHLRTRDLIKLRLRGQGSGHLEGPHKQGTHLSLTDRIEGTNALVRKFETQGSVSVRVTTHGRAALLNL